MGKKKGGAKNTKAKKEKAKKEGYKIYKAYKVSGDVIESKNKTCPKCGKGVFMANHSDRWTCGKCGYMEKK
jgi:small subunit ribosomal protein S27Ae